MNEWFWILQLKKHYNNLNIDYRWSIWFTIFFSNLEDLPNKIKYETCCEINELKNSLWNIGNFENSGLSNFILISVAMKTINGLLRHNTPLGLKKRNRRKQESTNALTWLVLVPGKEERGGGERERMRKVSVETCVWKNFFKAAQTEKGKLMYNQKIKKSRIRTV